MYTLYHGDCLDILPTLPAQSVDAIIADPPYGTTACKWDSVIPLDTMWRELKRVVKPRGAVLLFAAQPFTSALVMSNAGWFKYEWIWHKSRPSDHISAKLKPMREHEDILVFSSGTTANKSPNLMVYYPQGLVYKPQIERRPGRKVSRINGDRPCLQTEYQRDYENYPRTILQYANPNHGALHPTQKPVALFMWTLGLRWLHGVRTVLDPYMGSAPSGVACARLGLNYIGIERDATHFKTARKRMEAELMQGTFDFCGCAVAPTHNNSLTVAPDEQREAHTSGGISSP